MRSDKFPALALLLASSAFAAEAPATLADCARIVDGSDRLACYDRLAADAVEPARERRAQPQTLFDPAAVTAGGETPSQRRFSLAEHWELGPGNKQGVFAFRPHRPNYLIATYNHDPNDAPYRPFRSLAPDTPGLSHAELAFQIGFKMKLAENALNRPADIWFGYTQQSFWQAANREASSPFRETNYQPELMAVMPLEFRLLGMDARFLNVGLVHQSNGQTSSLSRSWNRVYAQLGMEKGDLTVLARVWQRIPESADEDDNPDITDYLGHGDLVGTYRWRGHEFSALTRYNFHTGHGALQLGWAFPLADHLKGYVQFFSGYGQSLIDYNYAQQTIGLGFLVGY